MDRPRPRDRFGRPLPTGSRNELPGADSGGDAPTVEQAFARAVVRFDAQRFFEAHELLELIWKSKTIAERDRTFWKGLTQLAVGCCHIQRDNAKGAKAVLRRAIAHLEGYPSPHHGVDTAKAIDRTRHVMEELDRRPAGEDFPFFAFPKAHEP